MRFNGRPPRPAPPLPSLAAMLATNRRQGAPARKPPHPRTKGEFSMRDLNYDLKQLCRRNRDGSYRHPSGSGAHPGPDRRSAPRDGLPPYECPQPQAQACREAGRALARREPLSPAPSRTACRRCAGGPQKIGKENIIARTNAAYGIADRVYVTNVSKATELAAEQLEDIRTDNIKISLRLQAAFGLRREESIKIIPKWADRGDRWCSRIPGRKGGRTARDSDPHARTAAARRRGEGVAKGKSLVAPGYATYVDYLKHFRYECERIGIHAFHGHRHFYAQARYKELTGWECPARGGPTSKQLTREQKVIDHEARVAISHEMGHGREQITAVYLGR